MTTKPQKKTENGSNGAHNGASHDPFDFSTLDILEKGDEPQRLELIDPRNGEVIGASIGAPAAVWVYSVECQTMRDFINEQTNRMVKRGGGRSMEEQQEAALAQDAKLIMGRAWENIGWQGKPLAHNFANARMLLDKLPYAIRQQIKTFAGAEATYLGKSFDNSSSTEPINSDSPGVSTGAVSVSENG